MPQRLSNTGKIFAGNNLKHGHCDLPVKESSSKYFKYQVRQVFQRNEKFVKIMDIEQWMLHKLI